MKFLYILLKHQLSYLVFLIGVFVAPLALFLEFSTYELPKVQYVFLVVLLVSQYVFYNEKKFRKKMEPTVAKALHGELKRVPSRREIQARIIDVIQCRGVCLILSALGILIIMVFYREF